MHLALLRRKRASKKKCALLFIVRAYVVASIVFALIEPAQAFTRDQLVCPVRNGWTEGSGQCPCQIGWKPPSLDQYVRRRTGGTLILCNANLRRAHLNGHRYKEGRRFEHADLRGADLRGANLSFQNLFQTKLQGANLQGANLTHDFVVEAHIDHAVLAFTNLSFAIYAPIGIPNRWIPGIAGLSTIRLPFTLRKKKIEGAGLFQLRKLFEQSGLREDEREVTFAIEKAKTHNALTRWRSDFWAAIEASLREVLFDWTTSYGLRPFRALEILLALIIVFAFGAYTPALINGVQIYRIWPSGRLETGAAGGRLADKAKVESLCPKNVFEAAGYALQFSTLSAFNIGWREVNVGNWIARLYRREHILMAVGWVRTIAGIQALISVYLLAIWVLTLFGRPFQ